MPILRNPKTHRFVQIDNEFLESAPLNWRAKAIFCYLLSRPDKWKFNMADIANRSPGEGLDAIRTAMNELQAAGYIDKFRVKSVATGKWAGWEYVIRETPIPPTWDKPISDLPMSVNPVCLDNTVSIPILESKEYVPEVVNPSDMTDLQKSRNPKELSISLKTLPSDRREEPPLISAISPTRLEFEEFIEEEGLIQIQTHKDYEEISWRKLKDWRASLRGLEKTLSVGIDKEYTKVEETTN